MKPDLCLRPFSARRRDMTYTFATAAVLMFRYYGIPARYAEGYLVTPKDAKDMEEGQPYELPMERAHAWPDIR